MSDGVVTGSNVLVSRYAVDSVPIAPVDPGFLKEHIQLTHDLDDHIVAGVSGYLWWATEEAENRGSVALIQQARKQFVGADMLPVLEGSTISLTVVPFLSSLVVKYLDADEATQTLPSTNYRLSHNDVYFKTVPELAEGPGTVWFEYNAGYGTDPLSVPAAWKSIVCMIAMRRYDYRGSAPKDTDAFERMIDRQVVAAGGSRRY